MFIDVVVINKLTKFCPLLLDVRVVICSVLPITIFFIIDVMTSCEATFAQLLVLNFFDSGASQEASCKRLHHDHVFGVHLSDDVVSASVFRLRSVCHFVSGLS